MKKIYFTLFLFILSNIIWSQEAIVVSEEQKKELITSFELIETLPIFPGCEQINKNFVLSCYQNKLAFHIKTNFRYPAKAMNNNIQGKVKVTYIIDKEGNVVNISAEGAHQILQKEAIRIISRLPKMTPGMQKGIPVNVRHTVPISFKLK